jgi:hypothetical protein
MGQKIGGKGRARTDDVHEPERFGGVSGEVGEEFRRNRAEDTRP